MIFDLYLIAAISVMLGFVALTLSNEKSPKNVIIKIISAALFAAYLFMVIDITLLCRRGTTVSRVSLVPFESYWMSMMTGWEGSGRYACRAIIGNVFMLVPLGMVVAIFCKKHRFLFSAVAGFLLSLTIETTQLLTMLGTFELDDLINNTWGAVIGCAVAVVLMEREKRVTERIKTLTPLSLFVLAVVITRIAAYIIDLR